ncbi:Myosuppressin Receptor 1-RA [Frankliniella occidentalis]|nr:Myosuppressin Receptor 1-RA [Frankliniella occidentalis]
MAGITMDHDAQRLNLLGNLSQLYNVSFDDLQLALNLSAQAEQADCYCPSGVREVSAAYRDYHGYVSLVVCTAGILANAINLAVLTRPALATAPVNRLLTGLAAADMLVMAEYAPFAAYLYLSPPRSHYSRAGATFLLVHMHFSQLLHTASICLTLSLAAWRYIAVQFPQLAPRLCTDGRCWLALLLSLLTPLPLCAPSLLVFSVRETRRKRDDGRLVSRFHVDLSEHARRHNQLLYELNLWFHAVLVKLLPCAILTAISISLMRTLYTAKQRKKQLSGQGQPVVKLCPKQAHNNNARRSRAEKRADRTTRMLLAVLLLFLATEFPQGVLGLMSGVLGRCFFRRCYQLFGEALDILALLNGAINFILYCAMSRQYRQTFRQLFSPAWRLALGPWCRRKGVQCAKR